MRSAETGRQRSHVRLCQTYVITLILLKIFFFREGERGRKGEKEGEIGGKGEVNKVKEESGKGWRGRAII